MKTPRFVRLHLTSEPGSPVGDGHGGPSHCSTARIRHLPRDGTGRLPLRPQLDGDHEEVASAMQRIPAKH